VNLAMTKREGGRGLIDGMERGTEESWFPTSQARSLWSARLHAPLHTCFLYTSHSTTLCSISNDQFKVKPLSCIHSLLIGIGQGQVLLWSSPHEQATSILSASQAEYIWGRMALHKGGIAQRLMLTEHFIATAAL
jgi:hypothetical protein